MRRIGIGISLLLVAGVAICAAYNLSNPWHAYRFRLVVELNVDGAVLKKSEVYEVRNAWSPILDINRMTSGSARHELRGEAIYFSIPDSRSIIVTMGGSWDYNKPTRTSILAERVLNVSWTSPLLQDGMARNIHKEVPIDQLPLIVTFANPGNPDSLLLLSPGQDLEIVPGRKATVQSAVLEMTSDFPDAFTIEGSLPWLQEYRELDMVRAIPGTSYSILKRDIISKEFTDASRFR